jgi:hypothetical protein
MDKIKINTQMLGDIPNIKISDEINNSLSPIILSEESSIDKISEININQNNTQEQD